MSVNYHIDAIANAWEFVSDKHAIAEEDGDTAVLNPCLQHTSLVWQELVEAFTREKIPNQRAGLAFLCAILGRSVEEGNSSYEELSEQFGEDVAQGVRALTRNHALPTAQARVADSLMRIRRQPKEVWMAEMADWIVSLSPPPADWSKEQKGQLFQSARMVHSTLADAHRALAARLEEQIDMYRGYI